MAKVEEALSKQEEVAFAYIETEMEGAACKGRSTVRLQTSISYERLKKTFPDIDIKEEPGWAAAPSINRAVTFSWAPKK